MMFRDIWRSEEKEVGGYRGKSTVPSFCFSFLFYFIFFGVSKGCFLIFIFLFIFIFN